MKPKAFSFGDNYALVLDQGGKAWTFGRNAFGELGNPDFPIGGKSSTHIPQPVKNAAGEQMVFDQIEAGTAFGFGLEADGSAWAWGRNWFGQLGGESNDPDPLSTVATPVLDQTGTQMKFSQIAGGSDFSIGLDLDGKAYGWGNSTNCASGFCGADVTRPQPLLDSNGKQRSYASVYAGYSVAFGMDPDGSVWSWGMQLDSSLGNPSVAEWDATDEPLPVLDEQGDQVRLKSLSVQSTSILGIDDAHHVWGWGDNESGQLGRDPAVFGTSSLAAVQMFTRPGVPMVADRVAAGDRHGLYLGAFDDTEKTNVWSWGESELGQLGHPGIDIHPGSMELMPVSVQLPQPSLTSRVFFGDDDTVGVTGTVKDGVLNVLAPRHLASRVPVYVAWYGAQPIPTREHVGYFTFMLDPKLSVAPHSAKVGEQATVTVALPEAEIPLVGNAQMQFELPDGLTSAADGSTGAVAPVAFDEDGKATLPVTAEHASVHEVSGTALVNQVNGAPVDQGPMVAVSGLLAGKANFVGDTEQPAFVQPTRPTLSRTNCDVAPEVVIPEVTGVVYTQTRKGDAVRVVAKAAEGYVLTSGATTEWKLDVAVKKCTPTNSTSKPGLPANPESGLATTGGGSSSVLWGGGVLAALLGLSGLLYARRRNRGTSLGL